ncbi:iron ABC transporter permease [Rhodococcus sp. 15-1154-1]|nr:iron ABC transporter permease [Rhodococcus sp. 15-1154-1]
MSAPTTDELSAVPQQEDANPGSRRALGLFVFGGLLLVAIIGSLMFGSNPLPFGDVWHVIWHRDGSEASSIVWTLRMPRTLIGIVTGAAFALAGSLIQALTRNPLADPGILGVNAGAGFAVTLGVGIFGVTSISGYVWYAFVGAALATILVYLIGAARGAVASPVRLVLAGVALGAVLGGLSSFLMLIDPDTFQQLRKWGVGSIAATTLDDARLVLPFLLAGFVLAIAISRSLDAVALGDDLASSLGVKIVRVRTLGLIAVTLLAGGATALTGGIAFVGLMIPHIVRWFVGPNQRWIFAYSLIAGPIMVLLADTIGRVLGRPGEIEAGIVCAVIGAPVLIALVRHKKASGL